MKIVVLDGYVENPGDLSWKALEELGDLMVYDWSEEDQVSERIGDAPVVVVNKSKITRQTFVDCPELKLICILATGYNVIDIDAAKEHGVMVANVPTYGTQLVAQYAVGMLLEICGRYAHHDATVKEGRWQNGRDWSYWDYPLIELAGKTAGIIGLGRIGMVTAGILKAMGMRVIAHSRTKTEEGRALAEYVDPDTLYAESDVIFLHCPQTKETENIINKDSIAKMRDGAIIINNGRGGLIVEQDLADALNSGKLYAAAVDVARQEPISPHDPLLTAKNCMITPHRSWTALEARRRILDQTAENIKAFLAGNPINIVNR